MSTLQKAIDDLEFCVLKTSDKDVFDAYQLGKIGLRKSFNNDVEFMQCLFKSFIEYYAEKIKQLPEAEQPQERLKLKLAQEQIDSVIKIFNFEKNILDKNLFLFYTMAYVNDIIRKRSSGA